jgi:hypothetical protein
LRRGLTSVGDKVGISDQTVLLRETTGTKPVSIQRESLRVKETQHKKVARAWKPKKVRRRLVIGMDVGLEETCKLSLCTLVGRFAYKSRRNITFSTWMQLTWLPIIGYEPEYLTLPYGWFGLVFKNPEDAEIILNGFWDFEGGSIMLKRWRTRFDPATEYFSHRHVWVLLPGLPLNLWNKNALMAIGNLLGHFLKVDERGLHAPDKHMARVLVELDLHARSHGLARAGVARSGDGATLDYQGLPFHCTSCRRTDIFTMISPTGMELEIQRIHWKIIPKICT